MAVEPHIAQAHVNILRIPAPFDPSKTRNGRKIKQGAAQGCA